MDYEAGGSLREIISNVGGAIPDQEIEGRTDVPGFVDLMEQVTDRARGRLKKEFRKIYRKATYFRTESGWAKEFVKLEANDQ